jgi:PAS domain S-box-containing protein
MFGNGTHNNQLPNAEGADFLWSLYEHARVGIVQVAADGKLKWANAALCRMLGYNQNELLNRALEDIVPPEDRPRQTKLLKKILAGKYDCHYVEERFLHRTGTPVSAAVTPLLVSGTGAASYCTNIVRDVTESKAAELDFGVIVESAPNPMAMIGHDGDIIVANRHCEFLFGYDRGELTHRPIEIFLPNRFGFTPSKQLDADADWNSEKSSAGNELTGLHKNGTKVPVEVHWRTIHFQDHECVLASITDMTDHNRALQNLQESEERFRTIFNDAPTGMALSSTTGRFIYVNNALCDFLGYSRNELSTKEFLAITHSEDRDETLKELQELAHGEKAHVRVEKRYVRKDGQVLWGDVQRSVIPDSQTGKPRYIVSQIVDITERKRMEQTLRETEQRFRTIADSAPVFIWMAGSDKLRNYFNKRWLDFTGRRLEEELGDGWIQEVYPGDLASFLESYTKSFDERVPFTTSYRVKRHDGEYRWLVDTGTPRFNPDGTFAGYIGSCIDETDRRAAEEALRNISRKLIEAQEKERKRIARELHDDINQRLAMLAIELQQLDTSPIFQTKRHERIERLLKRTTEISSDLQALSHELHSVTLEHLGLAAAMRSFCNDLARHQKVKVEFTEKNLPTSIPPEIALALLRVLQEGIHNAVKHSGVRKFQAELIGKANEIQLTIRDFGVGFDPEQAAKGEGLGLLSMKERILPFKGTLSIVSKPKHGTELILRIPIQA